MRKFQSLDRQARIENDTALETVHQNAITCLCLYAGTKGAVSKFSTSGVDGQLVVWDMNVSFQYLCFNAFFTKILIVAVLKLINVLFFFFSFWKREYKTCV